MKALAALYGLEPRSCGRVGQTLFKTPASTPLIAEAQLKVRLHIHSYQHIYSLLESSEVQRL